MSVLTGKVVRALREPLLSFLTKTRLLTASEILRKIRRFIILPSSERNHGAALLIQTSTL